MAPIYEYVCPCSGEVKEYLMKLDEEPPTCEKCGLPKCKKVSAHAASWFVGGAPFSSTNNIKKKGD